MELAMQSRTYHLRRRFAISQSVRREVEALEIRVSPDGRVGRGESAPSRRVTGYAPADCREVLEAWWRDRSPGPDGEPPPKAPFAGLDAALLDLRGRRDSIPVHELLGLRRAARPTSVTVSLAAPDAMVEEAAEHRDRGFDHLKVKVGEGPEDVERVAALRDAFPDATLRVDANTGWSPDTAREVIGELARLDVELVEQPVPPAADDALADVDLGVPIYADESVVTVDDVDRAAGIYDGIVAKVDKHGGPRPTRDVLERARRAGLSTMIGCNVQSSLGIAAAAHLLALADRADLDGGLLLADDGWTGVEIEDGRVAAPKAPGLGVEEVTR